MIVLDTNQLDKTNPPRGPVLGMLRRIARDAGHELAIPEVVLQEHQAHHWHDVEKQASAMHRAGRLLNGYLDEDVASQLPRFDFEAVIRKRADELAPIFRVLFPSDEAVREAIKRETFRRPPANAIWEDDKGERITGSGARDALVWLTLLETCKASDAEVLFVSEDRDFGNDDGFHEALMEEARITLGEHANKLKLYRRIDILMAALAAKVQAPDEEVLKKLLLDDLVIEKVASSFMTPGFFFTFLGTARPRPGSYTGSGLATNMQVVRMLRPVAYRVGDSTWISVGVSWTGDKHYSAYPMFVPGSAGVREGQAELWPQESVGVGSWSAIAHFSVDTTILLQLSPDGNLQDAELMGMGAIQVTRETTPRVVYDSGSSASTFKLQIPNLDWGGVRQLEGEARDDDSSN